MRSRNSAVCVLAGALALASCGTPDRPRSAGGRGRAVADLPVKVGPPYQVGGRTYVPRDDARYDETGYASWYGAQHRGRATANGERFDPQAISAAHTTLPLPSYVEVTALDTGRTVLVRINDRGPFADGRIIDLSQGAARLLGIERAGLARVRVRRVNPSEADRAALRAGRPAGVRMAARPAPGPSVIGRPAAAPPPIAPMLAGPAPIASTAPILPAPALAAASIVAATPDAAMPSSTGALYVQIAALADADRADGLAATLMSSIGPAEAVARGSMWRVRLGPYAGEGEALSALARARQAGYQDARIVRESAP